MSSIIGSLRQLKYKNDTQSQIQSEQTSPKQTPNQFQGKTSKFSRRFNLTGNGLSCIDDDKDSFR